MPETLRYAAFVGHLGETFQLDLGAEGSLALELIEVKRLGADDDAAGEAEDGPRRPFSLLFRGPAAPRLEQGTFRVAHETLGSLDIFLVPMEPGADAARYEAVFT